MAKKPSITDAAKKVLMKESNDPTPDRDANKTTSNANTLHPNAGVVPGEPDPKSNEAQELNGKPPVDLEDGPSGDNLGASAAAPLGKDNSKSSQSPNPPEKFGLKEDEEGDIEISEELKEFIDNLVAEGKTDEEIKAAIAENFEVIEEDNDETDIHEAAAAAVAASKEKLKEHVDALLEGEKLSEDFRNKATTIFESALTERLNEEVAVLEEAYKQALAEEVEEIKENLSKRVDEYLNYVVEQWVIENQVALDSGLRNELTEEFIGGLRKLFLEHWIDVPEDKVDVVEALGQEVSELRAKLNEEIERNVELNKSINEATRGEILNSLCEELTTTQASKLKSLAEGIEFIDAETFEAKVKTLKENYFPANAPKAEKALDNEPEGAPKKAVINEGDSRMNKYVQVLARKLPR